jgi:tripartite-type tricarboxylate transporter receptor subunit TctC
LSRSPIRNPFIISRRSVATLLGGMAIAGMACAQSQPPIRIMVGFAAGGVSDTVARIIGEGLSTELGRPVIVENKAGVGGRLAGEALKNAAPDGNTFLIGPDGWAIFQTLIYPPSTLRYDFLKDFAPVARLISYPLAFVTSSVTGTSNAKDYAAWIKTNPKQALYGTAGAGSQTQFLGTLLAKSFGTPMTIVPYKGNAPLATDLLGGQVPAGIMVLGDALKYRSEKLHIAGILADQRWSLTPDIATLKEQGYSVTAGMAWQAIWAPAKTPAADMQRMESALKTVLASPKVRKQLQESAIVNADFAPGADLDRQFREELKFWGPVIKESGFKPD